MVTPGLAHAAAVRAIYADAETRLIESITRRLARGLDDPGWASRKLQDVLAVRADLERQIIQANREAAGIVSDGVTETYERSAAAAVGEITALGRSVTATLGQGGNRAAIRALAEEASGAVAATGPRALRVTLDAYRQAVIGPAGSVLAGAATRRDAAQSVLDRLADRGITGFVDAAGRSWEIASYAEMATRTAVMNAASAGHTRTLTENGYDLARISTSGSPCPLCSPWEGRIVSLTGETDHYPSLGDAIGAGLHHPNCRHTEGVYIPGVSRPAPERPAEAQTAAQYNARQDQRYNERQIRAWKRREAAALDEQTAARAREHVRGWQARQRDLLATDPARAAGLYRLPDRERVRAVVPRPTPTITVPSQPARLARAVSDYDASIERANALQREYDAIQRAPDRLTPEKRARATEIITAARDEARTLGEVRAAYRVAARDVVPGEYVAAKTLAEAREQGKRLGIAAEYIGKGSESVTFPRLGQLKGYGSKANDALILESANTVNTEINRLQRTYAAARETRLDSVIVQPTDGRAHVMHTLTDPAQRQALRWMPRAKDNTADQHALLLEHIRDKGVMYGTTWAKADAARHEFAHAIMYRNGDVAGNRIMADWRSTVRENMGRESVAKHIGLYGAGDSAEGIAESVAIFTHPHYGTPSAPDYFATGLDNGRLPTWIERWVTGFLDGKG